MGKLGPRGQGQVGPDPLMQLSHLHQGRVLVPNGGSLAGATSVRGPGDPGWARIVPPDGFEPGDWCRDRVSQVRISSAEPLGRDLNIFIFTEKRLEVRPSRGRPRSRQGQKPGRIKQRQYLGSPRHCGGIFRREGFFCPGVGASGWEAPPHLSSASRFRSSSPDARCRLPRVGRTRG
jgi:hypothetical protein